VVAHLDQGLGRNVLEPGGDQLANIIGSHAMVAHPDQRPDGARPVAERAHLLEIVEAGGMIAGRDQIVDAGPGVALPIELVDIG
jgi:hypothetical protein